METKININAIPDEITENLTHVIYLEIPITEYEGGKTYIIDGEVNELTIAYSSECYSDRGSTIRFKTSDSPVLEFVGEILWANGAIPEIRPYTWYELSLALSHETSILAVLTPFKAVE